MTVDWSKRGDYIARHDVTPAMADEAVSDQDAIVFIPDYNSRNGEGIRTIGYSAAAGAVLTVITYVEDGVTYGANAWRSNSRDRRYYEQGDPDEGND